ncbi:hypothetical protein P879_02278 [Paragonimus westermani]|uniref:Uncharacterized protein n=1 Tax=Paragonimus westermani TaxID=34504 RepID=A0A8T0DUV4_9TREM|nr:hypothetical protein P879_02278 [Paragonimus westermani]
MQSLYAVRIMLYNFFCLGAFLIPYVLMLLFGGIPLFYMELALGQYIRKGAITSWGRICPLFKGVGFSVVFVAFYTDWFYNMIIAWSLYYLGASFTTRLPWMDCGHEWNTERCTDTHLLQTNFTAVRSIPTNSARNVSMNTTQAEIFGRNASFPVEEFFQTYNSELIGVRFLDSSSFMGNLSGPDEISFCLQRIFSIFIIDNNICIKIVRDSETYRHSVVVLTGRKVFGKIPNCLSCTSTAMMVTSVFLDCSFPTQVVWFTAIFPYVVLFILLFRGLSLDGSFNGIRYYILPDLQKLSSAEPWVDAATQVFFSLGPGFGVLMAYASYNEFHNNVYRDALVVATINSLTSLLSGFVVFSMLGYMAFKRSVLVSDVIQDDPVLVFSVYPEALSTLPGSVFWSIVFFLMLLTLGLDSSFGGSEAVITALSDEFPVLGKRRELFVLGLFLFYCIIGTLESTQGGIYLFHLFERMCVEYPILLAVFCETVCVSWIYGVDNFRKNIKHMLGFEPGIFWKICWKFIAPVFIMFNIVYGLSNYQNLQMGDYKYPIWANVIGWALSLTSMLAIPVVAVYQLCITPGTLFEVCHTTSNRCTSYLS